MQYQKYKRQIDKSGCPLENYLQFRACLFFFNLLRTCEPNYYTVVLTSRVAEETVFLIYLRFVTHRSEMPHSLFLLCGCGITWTLTLEQLVHLLNLNKVLLVSPLHFFIVSRSFSP